MCPRYDWLARRLCVERVISRVHQFVVIDMSKLEYTPLNEIEEVRICSRLGRYAVDNALAIVLVRFKVIYAKVSSQESSSH